MIVELSCNIKHRQVAPRVNIVERPLLESCARRKICRISTALAGSTSAAIVKRVLSTDIHAVAHLAEVSKWLRRRKYFCNITTFDIIHKTKARNSKMRGNTENKHLH